jgi:hypothetical protein
MAEDYSGRCAMCIHFDLYDKYGYMSDKYRCTMVDQYRPWQDKKCDKFVNSGSYADREQLIEKARANRL